MFEAIKAVLSKPTTLAIVMTSDSDFYLDLQSILDVFGQRNGRNGNMTSDFDHKRLAFCLGDTYIFPRCGLKAERARRCIAAIHGLVTSDYVIDVASGSIAGVKVLGKYRRNGQAFDAHDGIYKAYSVPLNEKDMTSLAVSHVLSLPDALQARAISRWLPTGRASLPALGLLCTHYVNHYVRCNVSRPTASSLDAMRAGWADLDEFRPRRAAARKISSLPRWNHALPLPGNEDADEEPFILLVDVGQNGAVLNERRLAVDNARPGVRLVDARHGDDPVAVVVVGPDGAIVPDFGDVPCYRFAASARLAAAIKKEEHALKKHLDKLARRQDRAPARGRKPRDPQVELDRLRDLKAQADQVSSSDGAVRYFLTTQDFSAGGIGRSRSTDATLGLHARLFCGKQLLDDAKVDTNVIKDFATTAGTRQATLFSIRSALNLVVIDIFNQVPDLKAQELAELINSRNFFSDIVNQLLPQAATSDDTRSDSLIGLDNLLLEGREATNQLLERRRTGLKGMLGRIKKAIKTEEQETKIVKVDAATRTHVGTLQLFSTLHPSQKGRHARILLAVPVRCARIYSTFPR